MLRRFLIGGAAMFALAGASTSLAEFCGAFCDSSDRAGRVFEAGTSAIAYGGGSSRAVRTWVPHLIDSTSSLMNGTAVAIVDGRILGANTSFSTAGAFDPRTVLTMGTAREYDENGGYTSNNIIVFESSTLSDTLGEMLPDGRLVWRANFGTGQNNLETHAAYPGEQTPIVEPSAGDPILSGDGIDGNAGSVFTGSPSAIALNSSTMFVGNTNFSSASPVDVPVGCNIWQYSGAALPADTPLRTYSQAGAEAYANANGVPIVAGNGRQTQPALTRVGNLFYVAFGVNDTTLGGSGRPAIIVIDAYYDVNSPGTFDGFTGAVNIKPPTGYRFVDHQATGGGSNVFENRHFDLNADGDIVALVESQQSVPSYAVLLYQAQKTGDVITGYDAPITIADAGPIDNVNDGLVGPILADPNIPDSYINAISGASINNRGNIAFTATYDTGIPIDPNDPNSPTFWDTAAYFYAGADGTLHQVLREFDTIQSSYSGAPALLLGLIPQEGSDSFFGSSLADDADVMVLNFRANPNDNLLRGVGVPSRGTAVVAVGHIGDVDLNGGVDLADLSALLTSYGTSFLSQFYDPQADFDLDGSIGLADLSFLLTNYGSSVAP